MQKYEFKDYVFTKENGMKIRGRLYVPIGVRKPFPIAIFSHGFGGNYRQLEQHGVGFAKAGLGSFLFDFCGGGNESLSDGETTEMSLLTELEDLRTVLREVKKIEDVDVNQIYLMGESQGGYVSALAAARYPEESAGLILWYPAFCIGRDSNISPNINHGEEYLHELWGMKLGKCYTESALDIDIYSEIKNYPKDVLIVHGDKDEVVDLEYTRRAIDVFPHAELVVVSGAGHGFEQQDSVDAGIISASFIIKRK